MAYEVAGMLLEVADVEIAMAFVDVDVVGVVELTAVVVTADLKAKVVEEVLCYLD